MLDNLKCILLILIFQKWCSAQNQGGQSFSLSPFPEPAGPFYAFPYSTNVARRLPIPSTAYGKCQQGKVYEITSTSDFRKYEAELQCIYTVGITPSKVPEGPQYGKVLLILNSRHFLLNPLVNLLWRGNFAFKAICNSTEQVYIGFHNSFNRAVLPTVLNISKIEGTFAPGECEDGRPSVIMDFTKDLRKFCPDYADFVDRNGSGLPTRVKTLVNVYPQTQILDAFRLVGRQSDGGKIFLGKTYFSDYYRRDKQIATIAFWYIVNYDEEVNPEFAIGEQLPPQEYGYDYMFPGVGDIILRYLAADNFISRPVDTLVKFSRHVVRTGRDMGLMLREYLRHIGKRRSNRRQLRQYFKDGKPSSSTTNRVKRYATKV